MNRKSWLFLPVFRRAIIFQRNSHTIKTINTGNSRPNRANCPCSIRPHIISGEGKLLGFASTAHLVNPSQQLVRNWVVSCTRVLKSMVVVGIRKKYYSSSVLLGFISGNITTSRRLSCSVKIAKSLSNPIPNPDCGGIPYSIASTKASSPAVASSSQLSACLSKFACCKRGSTNSE